MFGKSSMRRFGEGMRAVSVLSAIFLMVAADAQSAATQKGFDNAVNACTQALAAGFQGNPNCADNVDVVVAAIQSVNNTQLTAYCGSPCFPLINNAFKQLADCTNAYTPTLTANLTSDGVAAPSDAASKMISPILIGSQASAMMCMRNERGDFCMPLFSQLSAKLSDNSSADNFTFTRACGEVDNIGCCLTTLGQLYTFVSPGDSIVTPLHMLCPQLATDPPQCVGYGQSAVALRVSIPINGLNCTVYVQQTDSFHEAFQSAFKLDVASGVSANYITVQSVDSVKGVCTATLIVRAATDVDTRSLTTACSAMGSSTLTAISAVIRTAPTTASGNLSLGNATVTETTITGQSATPKNATNNNNNTTTRYSTGSRLGPSFLIALFVLMTWLA